MGKPYKPDYEAALKALGIDRSHPSAEAVLRTAERAVRMGLTYPVKQSFRSPVRLRRFAVTA